MARRGEIYFVDWSPGRGSEQTGLRPGLVIQNDSGNRLGLTTIIASISSRPGRGYPFQISISADESGLPLDSIVLCEQIQTIDQSRLGRLAGLLSAEKMRNVDVALHRSLGLTE